MMSDRDIPLSERDRPLKASVDQIEEALAWCPPHLREGLLKIKAFQRGTFGRATTQEVFDRALPTLLAVYDLGAEHADVSHLLHVLGIGAKNGARLPIGTVSAAMHRAKMRAEATAQEGLRTRPSLPPSAAPYLTQIKPEPTNHGGWSSPASRMPDVSAPTAASIGQTGARLPQSARAPPAGHLDLTQAINFLQTIRQQHDD
jgi:hypothetical protein